MRIILEDIPDDADIVINGNHYNKEVTPSTALTATDVFKVYEGTQEWNGIIRTIQEWFYGAMSKTPWCATSLCWVLAQLGLREYTLRGKSDNVFDLNTRLADAVANDRCDTIGINNIKYGDIIIFSWSTPFSISAAKHVACAIKNNGNTVTCIGGNQSDSISVAEYSIDKIHAVYRPHYHKATLKNLEDLPSA